MPKSTRNKEKTELIVGLCAIALAVVLLVALVIGMGRLSAQLDFSQPTHKDPTQHTTTAPRPVRPTLIPNPYDERDFAYENGFLTCLSGESWLGVDVSEYQGNIDWETVASQNIRFAMIRLGARGWGKTGEIFADSRWERNLFGARDAGLQVGVYFYSQAISEEEAREEARFVLEKLGGQKLDMPIAFDWEVGPSDTARTRDMTAEMLNRCAVAFCEEIRAAGYEPMVYFNLDVSRRLLDLPMLQAQGYPFWLAMYSNAMTYPYRVDMWQYTSGGTVSGIPAQVDVNLYFIYE